MLITIKILGNGIDKEIPGHLTEIFRNMGAFIPKSRGLPDKLFEFALHPIRSASGGI